MVACSQRWTLSLVGSTYSPAAYRVMPGAITRGVFHQRWVMPAGTNGLMTLRLWAGIGTGVISFGRMGFYNATRLGI